MNGHGSFQRMVTAFSVPLVLFGCSGSPVIHPNQHEAGLHLSDAQQLLSENHPLQAAESVKKALKRHRLANDLASIIDDMNRLSHLASVAGQADLARLWINKALVLESVSNHPVRKIETDLLGAEISLTGSGSESWLSEARELISRLPQGEGEIKRRLTGRYDQIVGLIESQNHHYVEAVTAFNKAIQIDRERDDRFAIAADLANLGRNEFLLRHYAHALTFFSGAYSLDLKIHNQTGMAFDLEGISLVQGKTGFDKLSARSMLEAAGLQMALGHPDAARKDISYVQTLLTHLHGANATQEIMVLDHWFDSE